jgi:hypothetical protein
LSVAPHPQLGEAWSTTRIERALDDAEAWFNAVPVFDPRVNLGTVVGFRSPSAISEADCVLQTAHRIAVLPTHLRDT